MGHIGPPGPLGAKRKQGRGAMRDPRSQMAGKRRNAPGRADVPHP